jgi:hypothetical protein
LVIEKKRGERKKRVRGREERRGEMGEERGMRGYGQ